MEDARRRRGTSGGKPITDEEIERLATEAEEGYELARLNPRGGRPRMGSEPAEVMPVRLDPVLRQALEERADADSTTLSEIIRRALRRYLHVA